MIKTVYTLTFSFLLLFGAKAQNLVKIGPSSGSTFNFAAGGKSAIWTYNNKLYVSFNKQPATGIDYDEQQAGVVYAADKLVAHRSFAGGTKLFISNGGVFKQIAVDTTAKIFQTTLHDDEAFWSEGKGLYSALYYSKNMESPVQLSSTLKQMDDNQTSLEFLFQVSQGYVYWKQGLLSQSPDTLMCRKPDGSKSMITKADNYVRGCAALGAHFLFITGNDNNAALMYSQNAATPVKLMDLSSNRNRIAFVGNNHFAVQSTAGIEVFKLNPTVELVKKIESTTLSFKYAVNGGLIMVGSCPNMSDCNFFILTEQADTIRINEKEGSGIEQYSIHGENTAVITRASSTTFPTTIRHYKNGVAQANITNASSGFSASRVITTESMVVFEQSNFMKPDSTGMYVMDLNNTTTALPEINEEITAFVYPNPAVDAITLSLPGGNNMIHVGISDLTGRWVYNGMESTVNISNLDKGCYLLHIETSKGYVVKRFIKQ